MFAQMKSGQRRNAIWVPCPCGDLCICHYKKVKSEETKRKEWICWILFMIGISPLIIFSSIMMNKNQNYKRYIEVNGKMCDIVYVEDGINSTGYGHEKADCSKFK
jgi:hypothetical protein